MGESGVLIAAIVFLVHANRDHIVLPKHRVRIGHRDDRIPHDLELLDAPVVPENLLAKMDQPLPDNVVTRGSTGERNQMEPDTLPLVEGIYVAWGGNGTG